MAQKAEEVPDPKSEIGQAEVTKQWVVDALAEIAEVCLGRRDAANGKRIYNPPAANRALELLGKEFGMFKGTGAPLGDPYDLKGIDKRGVFSEARLRRLFQIRFEDDDGNRLPGGPIYEDADGNPLPGDPIYEDDDENPLPGVRASERR